MENLPVNQTIKKTELEIKEDLSSLAHKQLDALSSLSKHHVHISFGLIGALIVVFILLGVGAYLGNKSWERAMDRAENSEKLLQTYKQESDQAKNQLQQQLLQDQAERVKAQQKIDDIEKSINNRDSKTNQKILEIKNPDKTITQAISDLTVAYSSNPIFHLPWVPKITVDGKSAEFNLPHIQEFAATKIEDDQRGLDLTDKDKQLQYKNGQVSSLTSDLDKSKKSLITLQTTEDQCEKTVKDYKKVAKKSRFRSIMQGAEKVGLFLAGAYIGHRI